jgi:hypothetical protein
MIRMFLGLPDPGWKNPDPRSRIEKSRSGMEKIPDPQHCMSGSGIPYHVVFMIKVADTSRPNRNKGSRYFRVVDPDPDWIRIQSGLWIRIRIRNPDPDPGGQKWPTKVEKNLLKFMFWSVGRPLLRAEGFFYNLDILYGGLGIEKLQFLFKKKTKKFSAVIFFQFLVIKALDPYWIRIRIRIGLQHHTLDPDPEKMNTDPQPCGIYLWFWWEFWVGAQLWGSWPFP